MARVAVLGLADPDTVTSGGTARTRAVVAALRALGHDVDVVVPGDAGTASVGARLPSGLGALKRHYLPLPTVTGGRNPALAAQLADDGPYDLVVVAALSQVGLATAVGAPVWLDFMDLWSTFCAREAAHRRGPARLTATAQAAHLRRVEDRACAAAAVVTAAGWRDAEVLGARGTPVHWWPTALPPPTTTPAPPTTTPAPPTTTPAPSTTAPSPRVTPARTGVRTVGLLGDFTYWPNLDAHDALLRHWLPGLRATGRHVVVAGRASDTLPAAPGVELQGPLDDVAAFYDRVDAVLAPVRLGGGIKVKVVEALLHGVPVVATPVALEGFPPPLRALARAVELDAPVAPVLDDLVAPPPDDPRLRPFTAAGAVDAVSGVLAGVLAHDAGVAR